MSTLPQWPTWTCPHCGEQWHSGREYCVTCKHGMVQTETGQWVPQSALPPDNVLLQATSVPPPPSSAPATAVIEQAFRDMTTLQQEAALREDRLRRVEGELAIARDQESIAKRHAAALEQEQAAFLQRAEMAEQRVAQYEEQVYLWCKPLLMALREEGVPVSLDTVIPVTVQLLHHPKRVLDNAPDVLAMVAQLELRVQSIEAGMKREVLFAEQRPYVQTGPQRPSTQQEGAWQQHKQAMSDQPPKYPTWILTDAMQARMERDLIQEQTLRGGPAYGGEAPRQ